MTRVIDLTPTNRGGSPARPNSDLACGYEAACEYIERVSPRPFSKTDVFRACGSMPAARQVIRHFLALEFIERISDPGDRPVYYRVLPHAMPVAVRTSDAMARAGAA